MNKIGLNEIREKFLSFFESKNHLRLKSFSLVPQNDKSLLIINSGMAPMKPFFAGIETPPRKRVATCQKCVRTGDIDNVGVTSRHCTFFEMLGNFSFGDYFKEEIIPWAWEFCTEVVKMPQERIYISVYEEDDEAFSIWKNKVGVPENRIVRLGKEDNFWEHGAGPCGPSSELYYDRGEKYGCGKPDCAPGCDCDRFVEFWNLVFTQFNSDGNGTYSKLSQLNIDTGMGLERMAAILQDVPSVFDVDTIKMVRDEVCLISGKSYGASVKTDKSVRIITDHVRSVTFMLADGILPSNEGRGYVLRRLLRRAARHGKLLGIKDMFLSSLANTVIDISKDAYPELSEKKDYINKILRIEESHFYATLDQGTEILKSNISTLRSSGKTQLSGKDTFRLYDTYGFPPELTTEILSEEGFSIDEAGFKEEMRLQRERGRAAREEQTYMGAEETVFDKLDSKLTTKFTGYFNLSGKSKITAIVSDGQLVNTAGEGDEVCIITAETPIYAESGGQKGDFGTIKTETGEVNIFDCTKVTGGRFAQKGNVLKGTVSVEQEAEIFVDTAHRLDTARNHSATHLLQRALRVVLGTHVEQAGSYVDSEKLRFDFTHFEPISKNDITEIEKIVNEAVLSSLPVTITETTIEKAREAGAMALFGEKYGDIVRVVKMGDSVELCGGTHLENTAQVGAFKITSESGVAAGVRRIEAVTGRGALSYFRNIEETLKEVYSTLKTTPDGVIKRIEQLQAQNRELLKETEKFRAAASLNIVDDLLKSAQSIDGISIITYFGENLDIPAMRDLSDKIKDKVSAVTVLLGSKDGKKHLMITASDSAVKKGINCGSLIKEIAHALGGSGGGRANMAQAGVSDLSNKESAFKTLKEKIRTIFS